jgi:hypothetical protein
LNKNCENGHTKKEGEQTFLKWFLLCAIKDQIKMFKISFFDSHAMPKKYCQFSQKMPFSWSIMSKIGLQKQLRLQEEQTFLKCFGFV